MKGNAEATAASSFQGGSSESLDKREYQHQKENKSNRMLIPQKKVLKEKGRKTVCVNQR